MILGGGFFFQNERIKPPIRPQGDAETLGITITIVFKMV